MTLHHRSVRAIPWVAGAATPAASAALGERSEVTWAVACDTATLGAA